jgi:translocation and assembly module TamB
MKRFFLILCLILPLSLQAETDDRGFLEGLLEDNLSGAGRDVQIEGFRGALSSNATIDSLTIADDDGIWLTLKGVTLNWNRAALLGGELDVTELSAKQVLMPRKPAPSSSLPSAEATPLQIPELPIAVRIAKFSAPHVVLGTEILGQAAQLNITGSANLAGGSASVNLSILRNGGESGKITLVAGYDRETQDIALDLTLQEPQGGLAANMLAIPDAPPISLSILGAGPVSDFRADINLRSSEQTHLTGEVILGADENTVGATRFSARLGGDFAPLLPPQHRAFFGTNPQLDLQGSRAADGSITLDRFQLASASLKALGQAAIAADGTPEKLILNADLGTVDGPAVLLPLSGAPSYVRMGRFALTLDTKTTEKWTLSAQLSGLSRDDLTLEAASFLAEGTFADGRVAGQMRAALNDLIPSDAAQAQAIGRTLAGQMTLDWSKGAPVSLSDIDLIGDHFRAYGNARIARLSGAAELDTWLDLTAKVNNLQPFSGLAGRDLAGQAQLSVAGTIQPVSGGFDLKVDGTTQNLSLNEPRLDPFLTGQSSLTLSTTRDANGTTLSSVLISEFARMESNLALAEETGTVAAKLTVPDLAPGLPELPGPASIELQAQQQAQIWDVSAVLALPGRNTGTVRARIDIPNTESIAIDAGVTLALEQLSRFSALAGRTLAGELTGQIDAQAQVSDQSFSLDANVTGSDLQTGIDAVDTLLRGTATAGLQASRDGEGTLKVQSLRLQSEQGDVRVASAGTNRLSVRAKLHDLGVLAPELGGAASLSGEATLTEKNWHLDLQGQGPGGANLSAQGWIAGDGQSSDLRLSGTSPLALINSFIRPTNLSGTARYDLTVKGQPSLKATSGQISAQKVRLALPDQRLALEDIAAEVTLAGGAANVSLSARSAAGGTLSLTGPVRLSSPYAADLALQLSQVVLTDPALFETTVSGPLSLTGGLANGARISGQLALGPTELRVPNPSGSEQADLPGLRHVNTPKAVQQTRKYAGLVQSDATSSASGTAIALDLSILAPDRIFVRGRGLDAELGGVLTLKGDTNNVLPQGRFDLIRGRLDILGKRFSLTEGLVQLQGAFDPFIRFAADTEAGGTTATILIEGQASAPDLSFTSSPSLPQDEVLALILFGKDLSTISPLQAVRLAAAVRTLAGKGGEGVNGKVRQGLALDDLDVTTSDTGATEARAGKYISENIYSEVTADTEGNSQINLNLNINRAVTARGRLASDGETGIGVFIEKDY